MNSINDIIKDRAEFNSLGLSAELSEEEILKIQEINSRYTQLKKELVALRNDYTSLKQAEIPRFIGNTLMDSHEFSRPRLNLDDMFSDEEKTKLFSHNNQKIWFYDHRGKLSIIDNSILKDNNIYLTLCLDVRKKHTKQVTTLDRFLFYILEKKFILADSAKIHIKDSYLRPSKKVEEQQEKLSKIHNEITKKEQEIKEFNNAYNKYIKAFETIKREKDFRYYKLKSSMSRDVAPEEREKEIKLRSRMNKAQTELQTLWNSSITQAQKAYVIGWLCSHIRRITIKVVDQGASDKLISAEYPDNIYGTKYREKATSRGWDAPSGSVSLVPSEDTSVMKILKFMISKKFTDDNYLEDSILTRHRIQNLDFCLFLLAKYHAYGFVSGKGNLFNSIDSERLCKNEFSDNENDFNKGYFTK